MCLFCILSVLILGACQSTNLPTDSTGDKANLTVSAAVSLKDAFGEIGNLYKSRTGKTIDFNFGASGALQRQIESGAPVDVFASAGAQQMDELAALDLVEASSRRDFARNALVLIAPKDSRLELGGLADLADSGVQKIAVGNPKTVPAGQYTEQMFDKAALRAKVESKLILAEDVRQVLDYVVRGEVDAGIVYATDARAAGERVRTVATAPENEHEPILYPIALVRDARQKQSAQEFINLVIGAEGQTVLRRYGFAGAGEK